MTVDATLTRSAREQALTRAIKAAGLRLERLSRGRVRIVGAGVQVVLGDLTDLSKADIARVAAIHQQLRHLWHPAATAET